MPSTPSSISWPQTLDSLLKGIDLDEAKASSLMNAWLREELSPVQTGAFLASLRAKGIAGIELASMAKVLREACALPCPIPSKQMVDTCGTGGDGAETFNISTAVAFTCAACGASVAKHGNRSASGKVGSADVLEALGLSLSAPLNKVVNALENENITFLFAPAWHPSLAGLAPLRKSLGIRTIFNLLGPLVNPLRPNAQVLGVATADLLDPMASAMQILGLNRAVVVHGAGGLDEASLEGPNEIRILEGGEVKSSFLDPLSLGLTPAPIKALKGGDIQTNKDILASLLQGGGTPAQRDVVALNASLALWAAGLEDTFSKGIETALDCLQAGLAWEKFEKLKMELGSNP